MVAELPGYEYMSLEPNRPLCLNVNPLKQGRFHSKQGSFRILGIHSRILFREWSRETAKIIWTFLPLRILGQNYSQLMSYKVGPYYPYQI